MAAWSLVLAALVVGITVCVAIGYIVFLQPNPDSNVPDLPPSVSQTASTLLLRNLHDVFGETDPCVDAQRSMRSSTKTLCSTNLTVLTAAVTRSTASQA